MLRNCLFFLLSIIVNLTFSQELLIDLASNPVLHKKKPTFKQSNTILALPFIDDFSNNSFYPDPILWSSSSVYINRTYPVDPPTFGVATFDGLDATGLAYAPGTINIQGNADTLTSQIIDLSTYNDVYFLFYYQPQGIGDRPEIEDSLILEFKDLDDNWNVVWKVPGDIMYDFRKKTILINSINYLNANFQFRFRNKATLSGNFDHWHIDYIKIDQFSSSSDTSELNDISFVYDSPSFLSRYNEMPWTHFINNESIETCDTIDILIRNNQASINIDYQYNVFENSNIIAHYPTLGITRNATVLDYSSIGNFSFSNPPISVSNTVFSSMFPDSVEFNIQHIINTSQNDYKNNDTLYRSQRFYSHFSYDDGIAEAAYGINVNGAEIAYAFKLNRPDTLRAIQIYFPHVIDTINHIPFELVIRDEDSGLPGDTLYTQIVYPVYTEDRIYHTYLLDMPLRIIGNFFIGVKQTTDDPLNIGLDKNYSANNYMYYNIGSGWLNSQLLGSWMIRPIVSEKRILSSINNIYNTSLVYPNPASSHVFINTKSRYNELEIYNIQGVLIRKSRLDELVNRISLYDIPSGIYILFLKNSHGKSYHKLVVQ